MEVLQPDVSYTEQNVTGEFDPVSTAIPLLIGFTERGPAYLCTPVSSLSDFEKVFGGADGLGGSVLYYALRHYFDNDGRTCFVLSVGDFDQCKDIPADSLLSALGDARISDAIASEDRIKLVAAPDMVLLPDSDSAHWSQAWLALLSHCQARQGVFGLLDSPDLPADASACVAAFNSLSPVKPEFAAAYWPRLITGYQHRDQGTAVTLPPSAAMAALIGTVDREYGVWCAPANLAVAQVIRPSQSWLQSTGLFQPAGVSLNLIRSFAGKGVRVWGCRTLASGDSTTWLYVQVRRLVSFVETEVTAIARHFIFEPNNALTWIRLRGLVHGWLRELWMDGGLRGNDEDEAFYVQIGLNETMTQADIEQGRMIVNVGLAVAYPAEFIEVSVTFNSQIAVSGSGLLNNVAS